MIRGLWLESIAITTVVMALLALGAQEAHARHDTRQQLLRRRRELVDADRRERRRQRRPPQEDKLVLQLHIPSCLTPVTMR